MEKKDENPLQNLASLEKISHEELNNIKEDLEK